jgi:hypothetical protein
VPARPSEPLLKVLRDLVLQKGHNTAAVAKAIGADRNRARHVLAGTEPMTVDELLLLGGLLDLSPQDLAAAGVAVEASEPASLAPSSGIGLAPAPATEDTRLTIDPFGNQPEQLFRAGFALGCDFMFLAEAAGLEGSGVPPTVLRQYVGKNLPIRLDASYHHYYAPRYDEGGVTVTLSFDALYECRFPWSALKQFIFDPVPPPEEKRASDEEEDEAPSPGRPFLRLVT